MVAADGVARARRGEAIRRSCEAVLGKRVRESAGVPPGGRWCLVAPGCTFSRTGGDGFPSVTAANVRWRPSTSMQVIRESMSSSIASIARKAITTRCSRPRSCFLETESALARSAAKLDTRRSMATTRASRSDCIRPISAASALARSCAIARSANGSSRAVAVPRVAATGQQRSASRLVHKSVLTACYKDLSPCWESSGTSQDTGVPQKRPTRAMWHYPSRACRRQRRRHQLTPFTRTRYHLRRGRPAGSSAADS